jgi:hypothetical protein
MNSNNHPMTTITFKHTECETRFPEMQPGDEFDVLDRFAAILGLSGKFSWVPGPSNIGGPSHP